jgi:hypothetical protein
MPGLLRHEPKELVLALINYVEVLIPREVLLGSGRIRVCFAYAWGDLIVLGSAFRSLLRSLNIFSTITYLARACKSFCMYLDYLLTFLVMRW